MLEDDFASVSVIRLQHFTNDLCVLIYDGRKWHKVEDAIHLVTHRVIECEAQAGKCLSASSWYSQREDALRILCPRKTEV